VPTEGVEPSHPHGCRPLEPVRLPVSATSAYDSQTPTTKSRRSDSNRRRTAYETALDPISSPPREPSVTKGRVALPRPEGHEVLSLARLLIPPLGHTPGRTKTGSVLALEPAPGWKQPARESNPSTRIEKPAASPDAEQAGCQCVGQELNLHSDAGGLQPLGLADARPTLSWTVARAGVEPAIDHQGLSLAALPVCVPRHFERLVRGSHPSTPARQTGRDSSRATRRRADSSGGRNRTYAAWFRARCHYQQRQPRRSPPTGLGR
jgi:hypothetical protein